MADIADDTGGVIFDGPFDPDAQATVSDFIDYTEYLPCDLIRSLTLIRKLDERYLDEAQKVHELTKIHGQLPDLPSESRPNPRELRQQISLHLDRALNAREASYAEACRLYDVIDRHYDRLCSIKKKLESLPKPTPEEPSSAAQSPASKRSRAGKKGEEVTPRITLRLDGQGRGSLSRSRGRRSVLTGLNPDSPIASTEQSDSEVAPKPAARKEKETEKPTTNKEKQPPKRGGRSGGTGGGRGGATMSTSAALAQLKPPPEDAKKGSEDLPWLRLTDWEMARLRKKMKKNANWQPSEIMINRELAQAGRGWEGYRAAKARAEETGEELIDCDDIMNNYVPGMLIRKSEAAAMGATLEETKTSNRGMMLNEAKRLKRENMAREQAAAAAAAAEKAEKGEGGKAVSDDAKGGEKKNTRKRKAEEAAQGATPAKKESLERTETTAAERATGAAAAVGRRRLRTASPAPAESATAQTSTPPTTSRPSTRRRSAAASAEPSVGPTSREHLRRKSTTPAATSADAAGGTRRRKRPAPGPVSANKDGGAAVSYGRRKSKPTKKRSSTGKEIKLEGDYRIDEDGVLEEIDPNEPRYCLCGDVSFGTMICCENSEVSNCGFALETRFIV